MRILPYEDYQLITRLPDKEVVKLISQQIEPTPASQSSPSKRGNNRKPYEGEISGNIFKIIRIIRYRNSFVPMIFGTIEKQGEGTRIRVQMRILPLATLFIALLSGVILIMGISFLVIGLHDQSFLPALVVPLMMLAFGYFIVYWGFKSESAKSKKFLHTLFRADEMRVV